MKPLIRGGDDRNMSQRTGRISVGKEERTEIIQAS